MSERGIRTVAEFSPEMAGQVVGWSTAYEVERQDCEPYVVANLVGARIGEQGAKLEVETVNVEGQVKELYHHRSATGFVAISGVSVAILPEHGIVRHGGGVDFSWANVNSGEDCAHDLLYGPRVHSHTVPDDAEPPVWQVGPADVLADLTARLDAVQATDYLREMYYLYNGYTAHEDFAKQRSARTDFEAMALLPSMDFHDDTMQQLIHAVGIKDALSKSHAEDQLMKTRLTIFGDVPADKIPDAFTRSRRKLARLEQKIKDHRDAIVFGDMVYLEIGFRPSGRSWPYMDAGVTDEKAAFGIELDGLKAGNPTRANMELRREIDELELRYEYARKGAVALTRLGHAEHALRDDS